jgi:hypothetical protein
MQHLLKGTLDSLLKYTATRDLLHAKAEFENGYAKTTIVRDEAIEIPLVRHMNKMGILTRPVVCCSKDLPEQAWQKPLLMQVLLHSFPWWDLTLFRNIFERGTLNCS